MIDVENHVFDFVYPYVTAVIPKANFQSVYVPAPSSFPFATLMEMDNATLTAYRGTADDEEYAIVTYEANVYAEDKHQCREVMDAIDTAMTYLNFNRMSMSFIPNLADTTIFRITARFQAVADRNNIMYRR